MCSSSLLEFLPNLACVGLVFFFGLGFGLGFFLSEGFTSAVFPFAIRWGCCRAGVDLELCSALRRGRAAQLILPGGSLGVFEECSAALSLDL